ncbi:hypothetical protein [Mangrovicella endophytica]|uniref:hypothetical protein n=1 Tax=Mangrovicella endophytica TaxID=2066697 RepID=UPI0012FFDB67|nr:hypothetical protein [Mangrovicella endophytica]
MPDSLKGALTLRLAAIILAGLSATGCVSSDFSVATANAETQPLPVAPIAMSEGAKSAGSLPNALERVYLRDTARAVFRRRPSERSDRFVFADPSSGYATCVRSPSRKGKGYDYALVVLQRRVLDDEIPQAADDAVVMRGNADTAPCRGSDPAFAWIRNG